MFISFIFIYKFMREYTFKKFLEQRDPNLYDESFVDMATAGMEAGVSGVGAGLWDFVKKLSSNSLKAADYTFGYEFERNYNRERNTDTSFERTMNNLKKIVEPLYSGLKTGIAKTMSKFDEIRLKQLEEISKDPKSKKMLSQFVQKNPETKKELENFVFSKAK